MPMLFFDKELIGSLAYRINYNSRLGSAKMTTSFNMDENASKEEQIAETIDEAIESKNLSEGFYINFVFSPNPADELTVEECHSCAEEFVIKKFPTHQCIVSTHVNTKVIHSHIIVCPVDIATGTVYGLSNKQYEDCLDCVAEISKKHNLQNYDFRVQFKKARERREAIAEFMKDFCDSKNNKKEKEVEL